MEELKKKGGKLLLVCDETLNIPENSTKKRSQNTPETKKKLTYISCGRIINAMARFLTKTFSNCNQIVSSFLKNFDRVWKHLISVRTFLRINKKTEKNKKIYMLDSEDGIQQKKETC